MELEEEIVQKKRNRAMIYAIFWSLIFVVVVISSPLKNGLFCYIKHFRSHLIPFIIAFFTKSLKVLRK